MKIKTHFPDLLRVVISISQGKIRSSTILRKLGTESRKNKLYGTFRELGRVVRTLFYLILSTMKSYAGQSMLRRILPNHGTDLSNGLPLGERESSVKTIGKNNAKLFVITI